MRNVAILAGILIELYPFWGQFQYPRAIAAEKELAANVFFQLFQARTQGRLGNMQGLGRLGDTLMPANRQKRFNF